MKDFFKKMKESDVYEIIKDQSAMIIFIATLIGSIAILSVRINGYFYNLGRFQELNIPVELIALESFSFYDIIKTFAFILCYVGGTSMFLCMRMMSKTGLSIAKIEYELYRSKWNCVKSIGGILIHALIMLAAVLLINVMAIVISGFPLRGAAFVELAILVLFQWWCSKPLIKIIDKKLENSNDNSEKQKTKKRLTIKEAIQNNPNLPLEKVQNMENRVISLNKTFPYMLIAAPIAVIIFLESVSGISNYYSGKRSVDDTESAFQIVTMEDSDYVVLAKIEDCYILARKLEMGNKGVLYIDTTDQMIVSIEGTHYKLEMFDKVVLEDPK